MRKGKKLDMDEAKKIFDYHVITNELQQMMDRQLKFQTDLGHDIHSQEFISETVLAMIVESTEALNETKWKSWSKKQIFNKEKFQEEIIDIWHFLINLTLASGIMTSIELYDKFIHKNKINSKRQKDGY